MLSTPGVGAMATLAFVMAAGFIADTSSLPLVVSNLVNIVLADVFGVGFDRYAAVMIPVDLASILATLVVLMLWFRRDIPVSFDLGQLRGCAPIGSASRWRSPPPSSRLSYPRRSDRSVRSSSAPRSAQRSSTAPPRVRRGRSAGRRKISASPPQLTSSAQDPLPRCQLETTRPDGTKQSFAMITSDDRLESLEEIPEQHAFTANVRTGAMPIRSCAGSMVTTTRVKLPKVKIA